MHKVIKKIIQLICFIGASAICTAQAIHINNDVKDKKIVFGNTKMSLTLDYSKRANVSVLTISGQNIIQEKAGIYSMIRTKDATYSTLMLFSDPKVSLSDHTVYIKDIKYGDKNLSIVESWTFTISSNDIALDMTRTFSNSFTAEKVAFPALVFDAMNTWEGAYQDYGGLAWFYLFNNKLDTYGVHSSSSRFWNSHTGNGLGINISASGKQIAMDYSRTLDDKISCSVVVAPGTIKPRFDSVTQRRRYVRDTTDVWAPLQFNAGISRQRITISSFDFESEYGRGELKGVNQAQVSGVLNTIARIGVIDKQHFGGNSWHTPYGPICLHEQYIAQMGLAINDPAYLQGYQQCLDYYRDHAVKPDGRVWPRWAYSNEDAMPKLYTDKGFYEAQWGYLLDANPDFVTNVAELYDQTGNLQWVRSQQRTCEKALEWLMKRDHNGNGLVEMITDSHTQKRGSDWIDIIWAAYENAFVNAKLYHALVLWADIEKQLGNTIKEKQYKQFASKLKTSFNKSVADGGFWDIDKKCYIHWRDKDGTIHGTNMVTPVNFMAIAYDICEDSVRSKKILDDIEVQMQKENLFFWPICMYSYAPGEGNDWQFPFPNYENGDIFLSWGAVAVKAYAMYRPELALKYVKNVLAQYAIDGLAFQRYGRARQDGLGDDILSGNSLAVVGLYQAIYGINPRYNRFYLNPHITEALAGSKVKYKYRDQSLTIDLDLHKYGVSNERFKITAERDFGFFSNNNELHYFNGDDQSVSLKVNAMTTSGLELEIKLWTRDEMVWTQKSNDQSSNKLVYQVNGLIRGSYYTIMANKKIIKRVKSNPGGSLNFEYKPDHFSEVVQVLNQ